MQVSQYVFSTCVNSLKYMYEIHFATKKSLLIL